MTRYASVILCAALLASCGPKNSTEANNAATGTGKITGFQKLGIKDETPGTGPAAKKGDTVLVSYIGTFTDGRVFDSNMEKDYSTTPGKEPYPVTIGMGSVIRGWDEGLVGTKEGMVRKLEIPYEMAYGAEGQGENIPPKADLMFTVKIEKLYQQGLQPEVVWKDLKIGTGPKVTKDSTVVITYKGTTMSGKVFDKREELSVKVSQLIPGMNECVIGMQAGGRRTVSWPPGSPNPTGTIPPNQPVDFTIDLISVN